MIFYLKVWCSIKSKRGHLAPLLIHIIFKDCDYRVEEKVTVNSFSYFPEYGGMGIDLELAG